MKLRQKVTEVLLTINGWIHLFHFIFSKTFKIGHHFTDIYSLLLTFI